MKSFAIYILGCKVNHYEATYVKEKLLENNYQEVNFNDKADIYIIFTCCVTNVAESKTRKYIHRARKNNKDGFVVVVGCLPQIKPNDFNEYDLVIGSNNKEKIVEYIINNKKANLVNNDINNKFEDLAISSYPDRSRAFLKIQDGCNQYCTFCIIPYSRGKERSKNHVSVINEAKNLLITDDLIELFKHPKFGKNIHIPVQSMSDEILKLMHRPYTYEYFKERIEYIRSKIPNISISTDLIVGFPNESDELFDITYERLKGIKFSFVHVFPYSRKKDTVADTYENHLNKNIKKDRVNKVIELSKKISKEYNSSFIGEIVEVLVEKNDKNKSYGYSKQYFYVEIDGIYNIGDIIKVKISNVNDDKITGEYVSE